MQVDSMGCADILSNPKSSKYTLALFGLLHIRLVRLLFSVGTVFFSQQFSRNCVFQPVLLMHCYDLDSVLWPRLSSSIERQLLMFEFLLKDFFLIG